NKFKQLDIVTKELTLFDVGARGHFENPTTELLSFFLDTTKAHNLEDCFFKGIKYLLENKNKMATFGSLENVETEVSTAKGNRIDLLIETKNALIIVECKIYHEQNNPFDDYTSYGMQRIKDNKKEDEQDKTLVQIVLCLDGRIDDVIKSNGWYGISYQKLVEAIEPYLSKALLDNPYNKWGLFAREFLLHLKELDNVGEISKDEIEFLTENINDYFKLSEYLYKDIIPKIAAKINIDLRNSLQGFSGKTKIDKWNYYEPYIRFYNERWVNSSSGVVFCIRKDDKSNEMTFTIHIEFYDNLGDLLIKLEEIIKEYRVDPSLYDKKLQNNNVWFMWKYNEFSITEVSKRIIELMKILDDYELNIN
ncbi:PD-(D/E)XK nuclease family protein, partial [Marinobacter sp. 1Y8]